MMNKYELENGEIFKNGIKLTPKQVCNQLNHLEETRIRKGKEIAKLRKIDDLHRDFMYGMDAYFKLKEIWY